MNAERHLDPPDFETVEEILEGCFTPEQANEFAVCHAFVDWYDNFSCDEDLTPENETKYKACAETLYDLLDEVKSNCQGSDLSDTKIIDHLLYAGR